MLMANNQERLVLLVQHAAGEDAGGRQSAEVALCQQEFQVGYLPFVMDTLLSAERRPSDRLLLVIYLKYLLNKGWRTLEVNEEDKRVLRPAMVRLLMLDQQQLAKHSAHCVARLFLLDDSRSWEGNMQRLVQLISRDQGNMAECMRGMLAVKELLKELRGADSPKLQVADHFIKIFPLLSALISDQLSNVTVIVNTLAAVSKGESSAQRLQDLLPLGELCRLAMRQMRMTVTYALELNLQSEVLGQFLVRALDTMKLLVMCCMALPGPHPMSKLIGKYLSNCGRMLVDAQDEKPMLLCPLLFSVLEFFCGCLTQASVRLPEPLTVFSLVFVRSVLESQEYKDEPAIATQLTAFFTAEKVMHLAERLMTDFLCLTQDDLQRWQQSGEEFFVEEVRCAWLERIRPAAEILMGTLLRMYTDMLSPVIAQGYNKALSMENLSDDKSAWALQTEVLYAVIAMAPPTLEKILSLEAMMAGIELHTAQQQTNPWYRLLRRRIAMILETWGCREPKLYNTVYRLIFNLMNDADIVVRLYAIMALKGAVDHPNFRLQEFEPYIPGVIASIIRAEKETQASDTYVQLLFVLQLLIRQLGNQIVPYAQVIVEGLSALWSQPNSQFMTRAAVLQSLRSLVEAMGLRSQALWPVLLPLIRTSTDPLQRDPAQIIEEGLSLWYHVLLRAPDLTSDLMELFTAIPAIVNRERTPAAAKYAARLLEGYALLGKGAFVQQYAGVLRDVLERLVSEGSSMVVVTGTVNTLLQLFPAEAAALLAPTLIRLLFRILTFHGVDTALMIANYLSVFARLLLHQPSAFFAVMDQASNSEMNSNRENLFGVLLNTWIVRMEDWALQKVNTMALSTIITHPSLSPDQVAKLTQLCIYVQQRVSPLPESPEAAAQFFPVREGMGKLEQEIALLHRTDPVYMQSVKEFALRYARSDDSFIANFGNIINLLAAVRIENK